MAKRDIISRKIRDMVSFRDNGICCLCGKRADYSKWKDGYWHYYEIITRFNDEYHLCFEIDHIIPLCHGGKTTLQNLRLLCRKCNRKKGSMERKNGMV